MLSTRQKLAMATAASHVITGVRRTFGRPSRVRVRRGGVRWALDLDEGIDLSIFLLGRFERRTLAACLRRLSPGDVVFDIGANIGAYALYLAARVGPGGRVVAFEPTDFAFGKLTANIALNPHLANRIIAEQLMLGDDLATTVPALYSSWPLTRDERLHPQHGGRLMTTSGARAATLDAYVEQAGLDRVRLVKLDVDGHECRVLRGATNVLARLKPLLVMELAPYTLDAAGDSVEDLLRILGETGYQLTSLFDGAMLPAQPDVIRSMIPEGHSVNVLGTPR